MNAKSYRSIYNEELGAWVAVSEETRARGKRSTPSSASASSAGASSSGVSALRSVLHPLALASMLILNTAALWIHGDAQAQIVADRRALGANQPTVLRADNGVTVVNITTPNASGISRNVYIQFDVDGRGVVMNNGRAMNRTELAGWIAANPWLAKGSARVILNEVNSSNPSYINGFIEIAGQKADIIIANPNGINVSGSGFINASKATLTTGAPTALSDGSIRLAISGGTINITGSGLDARQVGYTEILARAVNVNAGVWAQELNVQGGAQNSEA